MAAPSAMKVFANNLDIWNSATIVGSTVKMSLHTSPAAIETHHSETGWTVYADLTNELANVANGYTTGGATLATPTLTAITGGFKFTTGNATWTPTVAATIPAWHYAVIYFSGALWGVTSPLLCWCYGDSAPADVPATATGNTLQITCPSGGWVTLTRT